MYVLLLCLTSGKHKYIMYTMSKANRNPLIRVSPSTRQQLKVIAAHMGETMQETVARLAHAEMQRVHREKIDTFEWAEIERYRKEQGLDT